MKSREKILDLLKAHPEYSARILAETIGITDKAVEKHLAKLKAEGLIRREGPDKGGKWIVNKEGPQLLASLSRTRNRSNIELFPGGFGKDLGIEGRYSCHSPSFTLKTVLGEMSDCH